MTNSVDYHAWQSGALTLRGQRVRYATKPGTFAHGAPDPAAMLLAEYAPVRPGDVVMQLNCGNGIFGVAALLAGRADRVLMADRNALSFEAASRTLSLNGIPALGGSADGHSGSVWLAHGTHQMPRDTVADLVAIRIPHEKLALLQLLVDAFRMLRVDGRCVIAGGTNEGAKSAAKLLAMVFGNAQVLSSEGGYRVVSAAKQRDNLPVLAELQHPLLGADTFHQVHTTLRELPTTLYSRPGVFSWEHVDEATALLANTMRVDSGASVLDLGCGCGALGVVAARLSGSGAVTMLDADIEAVRSAQHTAAAAGIHTARALASDVARAVLEEQFDVVVTNPPFHVGKTTALNVPVQFIRDAHHVLRPGGELFVVANRTLPYEADLASLFGAVRTVHDGPRFKVLSAMKR